MKRMMWLWPLTALTAVLVMNTGWLDGLNMTVSDKLYQERQAVDDRIAIVGIDERALEEIGPYQSWSRDVMAQALQYINTGQAGKPAVVGIDILFAGKTTARADQWLADEALDGGNIVTAAAASFGSNLTQKGDGDFYIDQFTVLGYEDPYPILKQATVQGHINAMLDKDGILRHHLLRLTLEDGRQIPSFAWQIASMYRKSREEQPPKEPETDAHSFWYLPFSGLPGDFYEDISVADLLEQNLPSDFLDGKIVLLGPYAAGLQDSYLTAIDHGRPMYGVEYQANAIHALLEGDYKKEAGKISQSLILFLSIWLCALWFWKKEMLSSTIVWLGVSCGWVLLCKAMFSYGVILGVIWMPIGVTALFVISVAGKYKKAVEKRRQITSTFKRYVAPEIVNEILKDGVNSLELGGKMCDIAVLFVDIRGFTAMSEVLTPPQVVEILNRYLTLTSSCIMRYQGTLDKFVGDATMAFWGAPLPQEDYVMQAARAAMDMVAGSRQLSEELMKAFGRTVSFGIGIQAGSAVVGNIGAHNRMDYTAIGDTVNTAARLEANAPSGTIYISRNVAEILKGRIEFTSLGNSIQLKGKADGFEILTLDRIL